MPFELSTVCCDRDPDPREQRKLIVALIKAGESVHETDKNGVSPLHHAVRFRSPAAVRTLIEHGANVNLACRRSGSTPLHRAVTSTGAPGTANKGESAKEIIEILLAAGANPSIANKLGKRPIDYIVDEDLRAMLAKKNTASPVRSARKSK